MRNLYLRPWRLTDAKFVIELRNNPTLRSRFNQKTTLTLEDQRKFMLSQIGKNYNGYIIHLGPRRIGVCNWDKVTHKFGIAILPDFQNQGYGTEAMRQLVDKKISKCIWSEVVASNPALQWYANKLGFTVIISKDISTSVDNNHVVSMPKMLTSPRKNKNHP